MEKPFDKLVSNAGFDAGRILNKVERKEFGWGMDVTDGKLKKLAEVGIVDPAKVAKEAIRNAVSVATKIIESDGIVAEIMEETALPALLTAQLPRRWILAAEEMISLAAELFSLQLAAVLI